MPAPLIAIAMGVGGKLAVKAFFVMKMAGLKAFLTSYFGSSAAGISVGLLATAAAAAWWERNIKGNGDQSAIEAAVAKGVTRDVASGIVKWLGSHAF